ncbi:hypothetical protein [Candidatus Stoquefichus massiliensis]|uniref:hypothetical protein n=1 Tax=Candidatus Stoquefichus massiliensis TaxID=1470350 RepID=UPI0012DD47A3|nr:hypothetical protein [Candidatus Stoquefichus massiliensis]
MKIILTGFLLCLCGIFLFLISETLQLSWLISLTVFVIGVLCSVAGIVTLDKSM